MEKLMKYLTVFYAASVGDAIAASALGSSGKFVPEIKTPMKNQESFVGVLGQVTSNTEALLVLLRHLKKHKNKASVEDLIPTYGRWLLTQPPYIPTIEDELLYGVDSLANYEDRKQYLKETTSYIDDPVFLNNNASFVHVPAFIVQSTLESSESIAADSFLIADDPFVVECSKIFWNVLDAHINHHTEGEDGNMNKQDVYVDFARGDMLLSPDALEIIEEARDASSIASHNFNFISDEWVGHSLYLALYTHWHLEDFLEAMKLAIDLDGDLLVNTFVIACVMGAKLGPELLSDGYFEVQVSKVLSANTKEGEVPRPDLYHPSQFVPLLTDTKSQVFFFPKLQSSPNRNHLRMFLFGLKNQVAFSYRLFSSTGAKVYFIFPKQKVLALDFDKEGDFHYRLQTFRRLESLREKSVYDAFLDDLQYDPSSTDLILKGKPGDPFETYTFIQHFAKALVYYEIGEMDSVIDLSSINKRKFATFYNKTFFSVEF